MKFLQNIFEKQEHHFKKGGKFEKLYPLFEAQETILFSMAHGTPRAPHVRDSLDTKRFMSIVILALMPALFFGAYNTGLQNALAAGESTEHVGQLFISGLITILPIIIVSYAAGGFWEVLFAVVRKHEINEGFLVTGLLFPLILPASMPLWQVAVGISFGVVIGKEVFGGTGMNILNPALTGRAFLYFSYPVQISGNKVWTTIDGFSGATPLGTAASTEIGGNAIDVLNQAGVTLSDLFYGFVPGSIGETSTLAILIGAVLLLITGVGSWRVMLSVAVGAILTSVGLNAVASEQLPGILTLSWQHQLTMGGLMFGAVFMATDPVTAARTNIGKYIYGFMIGVLTILIRLWNPAYPEGAMLAILFMNAFAPLIDHYVVEANIKRRLRRVQV
ncbi:MAG: NADH:ubiquinone reductase (Na(+)-transporting) subunit B [Acidobacteria bacterium]|nr:MAG: NADH:ubiquinone reductase (Na(+)-transporting) subunit B [Acidobacteriota bacterium]